MVDPLSLSAIGAVALTEGIKFLYEQAGEVLKRWRDRKDAGAKAAPAQLDTTESAEAKPGFRNIVAALMVVSWKR